MEKQAYTGAGWTKEKLIKEIIYLKASLEREASLQNQVCQCYEIDILELKAKIHKIDMSLLVDELQEKKAMFEETFGYVYQSDEVTYEQDYYS